MVDIRQFFGNSKGSKGSKRSAETVKQAPPKKPKLTKSKDQDFVVLDDDFDDDDAAFDDDDDVEFLEELSSLPNEKATKRGTRSSTAKTKAASPVKTSKPPVESPQKRKTVTHTEEVPEETPKKLRTSDARTTPKKTPSKSASQSTGITAMDVLAKIPDAELPEDIPTDKGTFNYQQFKARQADVAHAPTNLELPVGAPNCLTGLTMVFTGVMPNLGREDAEALAKQYGAKVTKSISGKTSVVVIGEEAGPSKVRKIKQHKIKAIDEDGFIQLIKGMPEEGGDGDAAEKARIKREEEERKAMEESAKLEAQAKLEAKQREKAIKEAKASGKHLKPSELKSDDEKLWTVKYAPTRLDQLCGNKSTIEKLKQWLIDWPKKFGNKKPTKGETDFRAVLIHGPPGIGKTTAAHLVAESLGYDVIEQNASDVRSQKLLNSKIGGILDNTSVVGYFHHETPNDTENKNKFCIIMDEVDGMSGGDRGGVGQLAAFARKTQAPMILICNDKSLPKMRPFDRVTLDLPFRRPSAREMKSRLMTIALREHIKLDPNIIDKLVAATSNDIRQIINLLSTVSTTQKSIDSSNTKDISNAWQKNIALKPFDIIPRLLNRQSWMENGPSPLYKKMEWYFDDHAFVPLMMQENYLNTRPANAPSKVKHLELIAEAADTISLGDLVDKRIHSSEQMWSLMPLHAVMSTLRPACLISGQAGGRINFSAWLGQNSKTGKYQRLLTELQYDTRLRTGTDRVEFRLEYIPVLVKKLLKPLVASAENIPEIIETLDYYYLSKADWDVLMEYTIGPETTAPLLKKIPTATKSKFTRKYNSEIHPVAIFRPGMTETTKGKKAAGSATPKEEEDTPLEEEEPDIVEEFDE
ncbi:replication factor C subunit 1 [Cyberlindnera jadinii NRRL Y-1542]|uniref:Replication factor C subunit 1 n=1 Tax=Cyberlindnera jadinii (strain ATCC 18201 / CBS 1600 / BCRC 20928 / JCM 3617 / NBRC 0987 / NRRL Y-1542) TaxID=983966 RepID=A0A1E4S860_CYBJN|nr:DNA replication factor C, large subunit [Cyberlindnera jadinii NRRL Y-1542]ODV75582.1 DNA replication factor C, large subunit [Cyberlindnera jadinii NRRL Y-1542]